MNGKSVPTKYKYHILQLASATASTFYTETTYGRTGLYIHNLVTLFISCLSWELEA